MYDDTKFGHSQFRIVRLTDLVFLAGLKFVTFIVVLTILIFTKIELHLTLFILPSVLGFYSNFSFYTYIAKAKKQMDDVNYQVKIILVG